MHNGTVVALIELAPCFTGTKPTAQPAPLELPLARATTVFAQTRKSERGGEISTVTVPTVPLPTMALDMKLV